MPFEELSEGRFIIGSPDDIVADLQRFADLGVTHASLRFRLAGHFRAMSLKARYASPPARCCRRCGSRHQSPDRAFSPHESRLRSGNLPPLSRRELREQSRARVVHCRHFRDRRESTRADVAREIPYKRGESAETSIGRPFLGAMEDPQDDDTRRLDAIHHDERGCGHHQLPGSRHTARPGTFRKVGKTRGPRLRSRRPCRRRPVDCVLQCRKAGTRVSLRLAAAIRCSRRLAIRSRRREHPRSDAEKHAPPRAGLARRPGSSASWSDCLTIRTEPGVMLGHLAPAIDFGTHQHPQQLGCRPVLSSGDLGEIRLQSGRQDER